jgi:hypothetical protein
MHEMVRRSGVRTEPGQLAFELLDEQLRHNLAVARVMGQATEYDGIIQVQEDFVRTSFERMHKLAACCFDLLQSTMALDELGR